MCVEWVCVCVCACIHVSEHPAPLPLWPQRSCVNTHPPVHPLTSECVSETQRNGVCLCYSDEQRGKGGGGLLRNLRKKKEKRRKWRGREIDMEGSDLREGRVRHLEKRKSHWDEEEITAAQQWFIGENSLLHLSSPPSRPPTSLPNPLTSPYALLPTLHDWSQCEKCILNICNFTCLEHLQRTSIRYTLIDIHS